METELLLPNGVAPAALLERLSIALAEVTLEPAAAGPEETERVFYDTFDRRLRAAGTSAVYEHGRFEFGALALGAAQPPSRVLATELQPGPLRAALEPLLDVRALLPLARLHVRERRLRVLDDERKTVVRVTLEEPALLDSAQRSIPLAPRLRLVAVRGYDASLKRVQGLLERELGLERAATTLIDEAVIAAGGNPGGVSAKVRVPLELDQRAEEAVAAVLNALLEKIDANLEGTIEDLDSEFLHDFRVSVRRSRSVQREFKRVFPPAELARFRAEFRWLQQVTGDARDIDVYVLSFEQMRAMVPEPMRGDLEALLEVLRARRLRAHEEMSSALRSGRYAQLREDWSSFLEGLPALALTDRPDADRPIGLVAGERIGRVYKQMVKIGRAIEPGSPAESYHELRKKGKELRYLLELFGAPLYPGDVVKPMIKSLKALQDVLGRHQDREVQTTLLRSLSADVAVLPGGRQALLAMGVLIAHLDEDKREARDEFAQRYAAFAARPQRELVKDTFATV